MPIKKPPIEPRPYSRDEYETAGARILYQRDSVIDPVVDEMKPCFCIGPQPGHDLCPCAERDRAREVASIRRRAAIDELSTELNIRERYMLSALKRAKHDIHIRSRDDVEKLLDDGIRAAAMKDLTA